MDPTSPTTVTAASGSAVDRAQLVARSAMLSRTSLPGSSRVSRPRARHRGRVLTISTTRANVELADPELSWAARAYRMTERKPPEISFASWIDQQINEAAERGAFDNLPGAGKPLPKRGAAGDGEAWLRDYLPDSPLVM